VTKISSRTVRRRLNFEGYKKHPVCKKTTISPVNREKRKRFCRSKLMWTVRNHWKKVIFSDETKIEIGNNRNLEEILVTNWRLNWSVISPKLCLLSERSIRYIILSPRTPVFLPLPLRGKFSSHPRTRRLLRNLLIVLLFLPVISAMLWLGYPCFMADVICENLFPIFYSLLNQY
jgi:hypothetical protein